VDAFLLTQGPLVLSSQPHKGLWSYSHNHTRTTGASLTITRGLVCWTAGILCRGRSRSRSPLHSRYRSHSPPYYARLQGRRRRSRSRLVWGNSKSVHAHVLVFAAAAGIVKRPAPSGAKKHR